MVMRKTAAFFIETYRDIFTKEYDTYDDTNTKYSLSGTCVFCSIAASQVPAQ